MKLLLIALIGAFTLNVLAHEDQSERVVLQAVTASPLKAGKIHYSFELYDNQLKKKITEQDLVDSHTKKIHFIAYDASLNEFNHEHPAFDGKIWNVDLNLPVNGKYFFWAQGELKDKTEFSVSSKSEIVDGEPAHKVKALLEQRKGTDALTSVQLSKKKLKAGEMAMLTYQVKRTDGQKPIITPYLGASAHVIAVSPDGTQLTHVHPMEGKSASSGMLHATFPTAGGYRFWIQLNDDGVLKTIPLSVKVSK
jgi:hypothetical protein